MPINPKWPDFQFASRLRHLIGTQPDVFEGGSSGKSSSLEREQNYIDDSQDPGFDEHIATMSDMEDQQVGAGEDLDHLSQDEPEVDADDADFGDLEMFDSNASPVIYSQVSQLMNADDFLIAETGNASKHEKKKKKKKKKEGTIDTLAEPAELEASSKKRKRSKKDSLQESEAADGLLAGVEDPMPSSSMPVSEHLVGIEGAVSDLRVHDLSAKKTKKRKHSDSTEGKRKKRKARDHAPEVIIEATQEEDLNMEPDSGQGHADLSHTGKNNVVDSLSASDSDEGRNSDSQLSPSVARIRRRSISAGPQSTENGVSFKAAVAPMAAMADVEDASLHESNKADTDVEQYAREVWHEHVSSQKENGEDLPSQNEANGTAIPEESTLEEEPDKNPRTRHSTRRKQERQSDDATDEVIASAETPRKKSRGKIAVKSSKGRPPPKEGNSSAIKPRTPKSKVQISDDEDEAEPHVRDKVDGYVQGRFSDDELARLTRAVEKFRDQHGLTQVEMNEIIHAPGGTSAGSIHAELWLRLTEECPDRRRQKVINVTRKKFHNFVARGTWTTEQDAELSDLIAVHKTAWSKIAGIINRHPEDVRDRYRNYIVCGAAQKKDTWDKEEEERLIQHIRDAMTVLDQIRVDKPKDDPTVKNKSDEDLIDWQHISEMMERTRSRLQCITKWKMINKRLENPTHGHKEAVNAEQESEAALKLEAARQQLTALGETEHYRLVLAIHQASTPTTKKVAWSKVTDQGLSSQWTRASQLLFWYRLKQNVPESRKKSVKEITQYIIQLYDQQGSMPDLVQAHNDEQEVKVMKAVRESIASISEPTSAEVVEDSSVEEGAPSRQLTASQMDDFQMRIDPALSQDPQPVSKPASSKKRTPAKQKSKKALMEVDDPIEDVDTTLAEQNGDNNDDEELNGEGTSGRKKKGSKKTPSKSKPKPKSKSTDRVAKDADAVQDSENMEPVQNSSDSEMDDMEDLPARISPSAVKAH